MISFIFFIFKFHRVWTFDTHKCNTVVRLDLFIPGANLFKYGYGFRNTTEYIIDTDLNR